jgi:hypothetical protein
LACSHDFSSTPTTFGNSKKKKSAEKEDILNVSKKSIRNKSIKNNKDTQFSSEKAYKNKRSSSSKKQRDI